MHVSELNSKPYLLACDDVTVDLRDGSTRPPDPSDLITRCCPVRYDDAATAPLFKRFLEEIQPDQGIRDYLQRLFGSAAYGEIREHVLAVFCGKGSNGKSVLADVVSHALGDHARPGPRELLIKQGHEPHPTHIATLAGTRLVVVHETEEGAQLANSKVKLLTGGDRLTARVMRGDYFTFDPTHQLIMLSNYRPKVDASDAAAWRRLQLVPFDVVIPPEDVDTELAKKIKMGEAPGVLRWIVWGAVLWHEHGLQPPDKVRDATDEYRESEDTVGQFLEQCTSPQRGGKLEGSVLYTAYQTWGRAEGHEVLDGKAFSKAVIAHGYERRREKGGTVYLGLELSEHRETEDPRYG